MACRDTDFLTKSPPARVASNLHPRSALYHTSCDVIDFETCNLRALTRKLVGTPPLQTAKSWFEFVRDRITHSGDVRDSLITCAASETLRKGTGFSYAKSHLLCALLRANQLPAGMCYQRLSVDDAGPPYCLHGLTAVLFTADRLVSNQSSLES